MSNIERRLRAPPIFHLPTHHNYLNVVGPVFPFPIYNLPRRITCAGKKGRRDVSLHCLGDDDVGDQGSCTDGNQAQLGYGLLERSHVQLESRTPGVPRARGPGKLFLKTL